VIGRWVSLLAVRAAARLAVRLLKIAVAAAVIIAAAPVSVCAGISVAAAWLAGWPPARLYRAALWCVPMVAVWLAAIAATRGMTGLAQAPYQAWLAMWRDGAAGRYPAAAAVIAPAAIPLGLACGAAAWSYRIRSMEAGSGGLSPAAAVAFDLRQWRHQARSARARIAAPGSVPLNSYNGGIIAGAVIRSVGHPARRTAVIPYQRMRAHQVVIGTSGTGKTTLLLRLWAGFVASALQRYAAGTGSLPLLVVLDCKGGGDARRIADRARRVLRAAGAATTAIWPDEASLSLWTLPPGQLITTLVDLIEHGTGGAAYYADIMEAVVALAVEAPTGPPQDTADFLARLEPGWLAMAYSAAEHDDAQALIRAAGRQTGDIALRFRTLFRRLGGGLDGPGGFGDADAWYCIVEGTAEASVAESQARALVDLLASYATAGQAGQGRSGGRREILLAVDEFSAVSRRLPIWQLYERARSLGLAVQVSAQSWPGLAADEDERYRIAAAADGGIWLLRTPHPEPVAALAGSRKVTDTTRRLLGVPLWSHQGTSRMRLAPVVDPALIRALDVGQAAYIYRGGATYVQVKRLVAAPAALGGLAAGAAGSPTVQRSAPATATTGTAAANAIPVGAVALGAAASATVAGAAPADAAARATPAGASAASSAAREPATAGAARPTAPRPPGLTELLDEAFGTEASP
jgi:hypothetical protein